MKYSQKYTPPHYFFVILPVGFETVSTKNINTQWNLVKGFKNFEVMDSPIKILSKL